MLSRCRRRRSRQRLTKWIIFLAVLSIILIFIRSKWRGSAIVKGTASSARLFCIILSTHPTHERFIYMTNKTWANRCDNTAIVRYRRSQNPDDDINIPQSKHFVNLWSRILDALRQLIGTFDSIYDTDVLVVVPAATFVFRDKLFPLLRSFNNHSQSPLIMIYEQQDANAYIANGIALDRLRNSDLMDSCLKQTYPSARENYLWKCIGTSLNNERIYGQCDRQDCFVRHERDQLTLAHIKNGFCLEKTLDICRTIALLYPVSVNDFLNLEFFTYRIESLS